MSALGGVKIAKDNIQICKDMIYKIADQIVSIKDELTYSIDNTILYKEYDFEIPNLNILPNITVVNKKATALLLELDKEDIVILNFASARNQGGGYLSGAFAQEEDLCRSSGLYSCLKRKPMFYNENILKDDSFYTDNIIYSPKVPFFRDDDSNFINKKLASVISSPAPNIRSMDSVDEEFLQDLLNSRAEKILKVAANHNHKDIILGAWGCGAFGNKPEMVLSAFKNGLDKVKCFENVYYAVYDTSKDKKLFNYFNHQ